MYGHWLLRPWSKFKGAMKYMSRNFGSTIGTICNQETFWKRDILKLNVHNDWKKEMKGKRKEDGVLQMDKEFNRI